MFHLNKLQRECVEKCIAWYFDTSINKKNYFVISGYAGTGKTSCVKTIINVLGMANYNCSFGAYTAPKLL